MNDFFAALGRRWSEVASKRGTTIDAPELDARVAEEILELARVVAHRKERSFAPLASFTAGVAAERLRNAGAASAQIADFIREVREGLEHDPQVERRG